MQAAEAADQHRIIFARTKTCGQQHESEEEQAEGSIRI